LGGAPPARHDAPRRVPEEADGTVVAKIMKHLLPVLLLGAACNQVYDAVELRLGSLRKKLVVNLFFEASTRTRISFDPAAG